MGGWFGCQNQFGMCDETLDSYGHQRFFPTIVPSNSAAQFVRSRLEVVRLACPFSFPIH